jgi:hypothetical protein
MKFTQPSRGLNAMTQLAANLNKARRPPRPRCRGDQGRLVPANLNQAKIGRNPPAIFAPKARTSQKRHDRTRQKRLLAKAKPR